ncbi:hypothetical protein T4A_5 [Trichinella pseudospiralis]|uniref:Uncharacterized protein n=1 Tax=Trichinella pseudospiralis TaxID=6337 RepID=A0A0V1ETF4_TRIPS|nr:hypothetical protein T4A_5 [Trichinella pseudospiralis]
MEILNNNFISKPVCTFVKELVKKLTPTCYQNLITIFNAIFFFQFFNLSYKPTNKMLHCTSLAL